ncbi:MAG: hypothetical protein WAX85_03190 [Minisyncoccia bacterium]
MTNLNILKIIIDTINSKEKVSTEKVGLKVIYNFFKKLETEKNKFNYAYLNYYLYNNISKETVAKRKTTSRDFEDILATIFDGVITDEEKRVNSNKLNFYLENETITGFAISNKREKSDVRIGGNYFLSVKTLMSDNKEINFGSLEKTTLFSGFNVEQYLNERKGVNSEKIGLGSKPRLLNLLNGIKKHNQYNKFRKRFSNLVKFVFSDDLIILIKDKTKITLYFIEGDKFAQLLEEKSSTPENLVTIINRWEGNSIRMNREPIFGIGKKINLDFSFLDKHVINKILKTEDKISQYFIEYVNSYPNNIKYKKMIIDECSAVFKEIDKDINILI